MNKICFIGVRIKKIDHWITFAKKKNNHILSTLSPKFSVQQPNVSEYVLLSHQKINQTSPFYQRLTAGFVWLLHRSTVFTCSRYEWKNLFLPNFGRISEVFSPDHCRLHKSVDFRRSIRLFSPSVSLTPVLEQSVIRSSRSLLIT